MVLRDTRQLDIYIEEEVNERQQERGPQRVDMHLNVPDV
jgi:hypothetical protein